MTFRLLSTFLAVLLLAPTLRAEEPQPPIRIARATSAIVVDGDLSEAAWKEAAVIDRWYEFRPGDNTEPAVANKAWITYDDRALYIAFEFADPDPRRINAPYGDQDDISGNSTDFAGALIDARNDGRTAMEFIATPRGVKFDAVTDDTSGSEDASPDFFWDSAGKITGSGWQMEIRIPFSSLRYGNRNPEQWGIMLFRNYPRDRRYQFGSNPVARGLNCFVCTFRKMTGLEQLPPGGHLVVAPYLASSADQTPEGPIGSDLGDAEYNTEVGADLKWSPNPDNAIDLTINPDFSQIESDATQINANERFALFYPEKRPFFLEGVELLSTPLQAVYTRTITAPRWGGRATGEAGSTGYTVLVSQDRGGGVALIPGPLGSTFAPQDQRSNVFVGRMRRSFSAGSFASVLGTARENEDGSFNRVLGPDFQWKPNDRAALTGQLLFSHTEEPNRPDIDPSWNGEKLTSHAGYMEWSYSNEKFDYLIDYYDVGHEFRADAGFMPQVGYRKAQTQGGYTFYPKERFFHRARLFGVAGKQTEIGAATIFQKLYLGFGGEGRYSSEWRIYGGQERVQSGGKLFDQNKLYYEVDFRPSQGITDVDFNGWVGEQVDFAGSRPGQGASVGLGATFLTGIHLNVRLNTSWRWLDIDEGRLFTAQVQRIRGTWNIDSRRFVRLIAEYVRTDRDPTLYQEEVDRRSADLTGSFLFAYKLNWQSVLFIGYGEGSALDEDDEFAPSGRQLFLKLSYAFQR